VTTDNGAVGPQGVGFLDGGRADLVHLGNFRPWVIDVGEDHGGSLPSIVALISRKTSSST